jgi:hypothetical protein
VLRLGAVNDHIHENRERPLGRRSVTTYPDLKQDNAPHNTYCTKSYHFHKRSIESGELETRYELAADHLALVVLAGKVDEVPRDAGERVATAAAAAEAGQQVQRGLLLDAVVGQGAVILQLHPCEDEPLPVQRDACK